MNCCLRPKLWPDWGNFQTGEAWVRAVKVEPQELDKNLAFHEEDFRIANKIWGNDEQGASALKPFDPHPTRSGGDNKRRSKTVHQDRPLTWSCGLKKSTGRYRRIEGRKEWKEWKERKGKERKGRKERQSKRKEKERFQKQRTHMANKGVSSWGDFPFLEWL